jgi:hypothetical protein
MRLITHELRLEKRRVETGGSSEAGVWQTELQQSPGAKGRYEQEEAAATIKANALTRCWSVSCSRGRG